MEKTIAEKDISLFKKLIYIFKKLQGSSSRFEIVLKIFQFRKISKFKYMNNSNFGNMA